jgi:hypothetical protein
MGTKTKPKTPSRWGVTVSSVELSKQDRKRLVDLTSVDRERTSALAERVEAAAIYWKVRVAEAGAAPTAPHVRAALEPIEEKARELAALLDVNRLPPGVTSVFDIEFIGHVWHVVSALQVAAAIKIGQLAPIDGRGLVEANRSAARADAKIVFGEIFDQFLVGEEISGDRENFVRICLKYL